MGKSDTSEFARLLEQEISYLRRSARRWYREPAEAEDLVQDTLVRALASAHLWQPGTNLRAWVTTIMRNQFFTAVAQANRARKMQELQELATESSTRETQTSRLELQELTVAIHRLPLVQRLAILMVAVDDKSYQEVAEAMNLSIGAVRCHLARGRARLRKIVYDRSETSPFAGAAQFRVAPAKSR